MQKEQQGEDGEGEDEDIYAPLGVSDEYDTILNSTKAVVIANRPPAPTPRPESTQVKEDRTPYIAKGNSLLSSRILCPSLFPFQTDAMELIRSKNKTELCTVCEGEFGSSCGREEVPGMCIAIVGGVAAEQSGEGDAVCFDPINHKNMVARRRKTNKSEEGERPVVPAPRAHSPLTVQFQRREYFMKMKHPKVTGIIKAYKSLKRPRLLFFILQVQTCTRAPTINCNSHRSHYTRPSSTITRCVQNTKMIVTMQQAPFSPITRLPC